MGNFDCCELVLDQTPGASLVMSYVSNDYFFNSGDGDKVRNIKPNQTAVSAVGRHRDWILVFALVVAGGAGWIIGSLSCPL